jgi:hypothetical protein
LLEVRDWRLEVIAQSVAHSPGEIMRKHQLPLLLTAALICSATISAKCRTGSVTVRGKVGNLPATAAVVEATVIVERKNGTVSRTTSVSKGEFTVEVPFSTISSSFLGTDRCHNVPRSVEVKIVSGGKTYVQKKLDFKDNFFEESGTYHYRLKQELSLNTPKDGADTTR